MLLAAVFVDAFAVLLFIIQPNYVRPMSSEPGMALGWLIPTVGIAWNLAGLGLMIRIYRADPEGHRSSWRFRGR